MSTTTTVSSMLSSEKIQQRAQHSVDQGDARPEYTLDRSVACRLLNQSLATEIVCILRYKRHFYIAHGIRAKLAAEEFAEHARQEQEHADKIAARIVQLGGEPDLNPDTLTEKSHAAYGEATTLTEMLKENLLAEHIAVQTYRELIRFFGHEDPTTRRILEEVLAQEEEHADDLASLLADQE